jgi:hypothetical protein
MKFASISILIALIFSPLASAAAFMITYGEYLHHYSDKMKPRKLAAEAAITTFIVFLVLSFVVGFLLEKIVPIN